MTGPQDPAAAGGDRIRAGHADREQVIETLKTAFVQGRLTRDELGVRAGRALAARTCADLAALTADIPVDPAAGSAFPPGRARAARGDSQVKNRVASAIPIVPGAACVVSWPLPR